MTTARHMRGDNQRPFVGGTPQPVATTPPESHSVGGDSFTSQRLRDNQTISAGGPPPIGETSNPAESSAGEDFGRTPISTATPTGGPAAAEFLDLRIWAESFNDAQQHRIATVNRMERGGVDADLLAGHREMLDASEHAFKLAMVRSYRRLVRTHMPAVEEWQKASFGIGEHLLARLLGHLGHPVVATPYTWTDDAPEGHECIEERCGKRHLVALQPFERTVGQLWQYCGHGSPSKRKKGMSQEEAFGLGNPSCKFLVHLLAEATIKCQPQSKPSTEPDGLSAGATDSPPASESDANKDTAGSPQPDPPSYTIGKPVGGKFKYRSIYDTRKASTADREWTDGHRHADALRIIGKEILRDLWTHAQMDDDTQSTLGAGGHA